MQLRGGLEEGVEDAELGFLREGGEGGDWGEGGGGGHGSVCCLVGFDLGE